MFGDDEFESRLIAVNASFLMPPEEQKHLEKELNAHEIGLLFDEQRGVQASIFDTIVIYVNTHLTELLVCGLLLPAAYDLVKKVILCIGKYTASHFKKRSRKPDEYPSMRMNIGKAEIIAPIPSDLSNEQFSVYMDTLQYALKTLADNEIPKIESYECFIVEYDNENTQLNVKTYHQYGMEQVVEQRKGNAEIEANKSDKPK